MSLDEHSSNDDIGEDGLKALQLLSAGAVCRYFYIDGLVDIATKEYGSETHAMGMRTFLDLKSKGLIESKASIRQGDLRFARNTKCHIYEITEKGRKRIHQPG